MKFTPIFDKNLNSKTRIIVNQGGTSSSKTHSILQLLYLRAKKYDNILISVVSETLPHLKRGAMRDFFAMLENEHIYQESNHNKSDYSYNVGTSKIEFFSADNPAKVRGARRDYLFINECYNIPYPVYDQLEVRTSKQIYLDYNPVESFWVHDKILLQDDVTFIKSTYKDNPFLDANIIKSIERHKGIDDNWWQVYGLGEVGSLEGIVYTNWDIKDFPEDCNSIWYGLDFGYTNDPTVLIKMGLQDNEVYIDELIYETGLTNDDITKKLSQRNVDRSDSIFADNAEPKSIEEIYRKRFNIKPALKGKDSIKHGINIVKQYKLHVTSSSVNTIKEFRNYLWQIDKHGVYINKPIDVFNNCMDAIRYGITMRFLDQGKKILKWSII